MSISTIVPALIDAAVAGVELAIKGINALASTEDECKAQLAELHARLDVTRAAVHAEAEATKAAASALP